MKSRIITITLTLLLVSFAFPAHATILEGILRGSEATNPEGRGRIILNIDGNGITFTLTWREIAQPTGARIHRGAPGEDGPVVVDLAPSFDRSSASGFATASPSLISEITQNPGSFYVNVQNGPFPEGVLRGELFFVTIDDDSFTVTLSGRAEVPGPGDFDGAGVAIIEIDGANLSYAIQTDRIANPTAAHIHSGSAVSSGDVFVDLEANFQNGVAQGNVIIDDATRDAILSHPEEFYVNVHNADFPAGAMRAQLASEWVLPVTGKVTGANETNFVTDIRILNRSQADAVVRIDYFALSTTGLEDPTATRRVTVPALSQVVLNDTLGNLFETTGLGAMTFVSDREMMIVGRVINDLREIGMGTNGLFLVAPPLADASTGGAFPFLSNATIDEIGAGIGFRTNVGFFNPSPRAINLTVSVFRSADGVFIGSSTIQLGPFQQQQGRIFDLVKGVPPEEQGIEDFFATWRSTGPAFVYVSVTDNATGDALVID